MALKLYPTVPVVGKSFVGVKRCVVPKQSMSLREIVRRFIRREQLPVAHEGLYEERFGDLEKLMKKDITEQMERVEELKAQLASFEKKYNAQQAKIKADKEAASRPVEPVPKPVGEAPAPAPPPKVA